MGEEERKYAIKGYYVDEICSFVPLRFLISKHTNWYGRNFKYLTSIVLHKQRPKIILMPGKITALLNHIKCIGENSTAEELFWNFIILNKEVEDQISEGASSLE